MRGETVLVNGVEVENVLVNPGEHVDKTDIDVPAGTEIAYTLAFPDTFPGPLSDAAVTVRGVECRTVGRADHLNPRSVFGSWGMPWDMTVLVTRVPGDMTAVITVWSVSVTYDDMGDPVRERSAVWSGAAQARMESGTESTAPDGSAATTETWWFVVPWQAAFAALRPSRAEIEMDGAVYDVVSVSNVDMRSEFASFKAVRRGDRTAEPGGYGGSGEETPSA